MFAINQRKQFILPFMRVLMLVLLCWFISQAVIAGQYTIGAIMWSLFPAFIIGVVIIMMEIILREGTTFTFHFGLEKFDPKIWVMCFMFSLVTGIFIVNAVPSAPIQVILLLIIVSSIVASGVFMMQGAGVNAICVFIIVLPVMIFERGEGYIGSIWTKATRILDIGILTDDIICYVYAIILICLWLLRITINHEKIKSKSWSFGLLLFLIGGLFSLIFISTAETKGWFINSYILPILLFIVFVNEINTWEDVKKLSFSLGIMGGIITFLFLYYALYRNPIGVQSLIDLTHLRGGGGLTLGSTTSGYNGVYIEYLCPMIIPVLLAFTFSEKRELIRYSWLGLSLLMIATIIYTFGRNGFILLCIGLFPWFLLMFKKKFMYSVLLYTALFSIVIFGPEIIGLLFTRFENFSSLYSIMNETRIQIWLGSLQMFIKNPLLGIGVEMFPVVSNDYGLFVTGYNLHGEFESLAAVNAHGTLFQIMAELGLIGIVGWCATFWIPLKSLIKLINSPNHLSSEELYWITAIKSNALVIMAFLIIGSFTINGIESIRIFVFILWLAVINIVDNLYYKEPI